MCHWWSIICLHLRSTWDLLMLWLDLWCSIFSSPSSVLWSIELSFLRFIASDYAHVVSSNYSCLKYVIYALDGCTYVVLFTIHVQCLYCLIWTQDQSTDVALLTPHAECSRCLIGIHDSCTGVALFPLHVNPI
jgi:hypothetical protein